METLKIADIKIGKRVRKNLGNIKKLALDLVTQGQNAPIGVDADNTLVYGYRRLVAMRDFVKRDTILCVRVCVKSILRAEYSEDFTHEPLTPSEKLELADAMRQAIGSRQGQRTDLPSANRSELVANGPQVINGQKTRDFVAEQAGFESTTEMRRVATVVASKDAELIDAMDKGEISITAAAEQAKAAPKQRTLFAVKPKTDRKADGILKAIRELAHRIDGVSQESVPLDTVWADVDAIVGWLGAVRIGRRAS